MPEYAAFTAALGHAPEPPSKMRREVPWASQLSWRTPAS